MHRGFVRMCAAVDVVDARFVVCGSGTASTHCAARPNNSAWAPVRVARVRRRHRGGPRDARRFGYPFLCGAAELVLQEAMYAGVARRPGVRDGTWTPVDHERTGLVATNEADYSRAIESLATDGHRRRALGAAAAEEARQRFGASRSAEAMHGIYERVMRSPKRPRVWPFDEMLRQHPRHEGAWTFISLLGDEAPPFDASLAARTPDEALAAEALIAGSSPGIVDAGAGGLLHYRRCYLQDAHLRLWSGLGVGNQGRPALAIAELEAARGSAWITGACPGTSPGSRDAIGASELAIDALGRVVRDVPQFEPGRTALAALGGAA